MDASKTCKTLFFPSKYYTIKVDTSSKTNAKLPQKTVAIAKMFFFFSIVMYRKQKWDSELHKLRQQHFCYHRKKTPQAIKKIYTIYNNQPINKIKQGKEIKKKKII